MHGNAKSKCPTGLREYFTACLTVTSERQPPPPSPQPCPIFFFTNISQTSGLACRLPLNVVLIKKSAMFRLSCFFFLVDPGSTNSSIGFVWKSSGLVSDEGPVVRANGGPLTQLLESNKVLYSRAGADVRLIFDLNWKLRAPQWATLPDYLWELQRFRWSHLCLLSSKQETATTTKSDSVRRIQSTEGKVGIKAWASETEQRRVWCVSIGRSADQKWSSRWMWAICLGMCLWHHPRDNRTQEPSFPRCYRTGQKLFSDTEHWLGTPVQISLKWPDQDD